MKINRLLFVQLAVFIVLTSPVSAQLASQSFERINFSEDDVTGAKLEVAETTFSAPGILPNHPLYFLKRGFENFQMFFELDKEKKAKLHQDFAKSRLAEAKKLFDENNTNDAKKALDDFGAELNVSAELYDSIGNNVSNSPRSREDFAAQSGIVLGIMLNKAPEHAKPAIMDALDKSSGHKTGRIGEDIKKKDFEKEKTKPENSAGSTVFVILNSGDESRAKLIADENPKTPVREAGKGEGSTGNKVPISAQNVPVVNIGATDKFDNVKIKVL